MLSPVVDPDPSNGVNHLDSVQIEFGRIRPALLPKASDLLFPAPSPQARNSCRGAHRRIVVGRVPCRASTHPLRRTGWRNTVLIFSGSVRLGSVR